MFGVGPQELLVIGLLFVVIFGPKKLPDVARDFGRFVSGAQNTVEEFKSELLSEEVQKARRAAEKFKEEFLSEEVKETRRAVEDLESKIIPTGEDREEPASDPHPDDAD